MARVLIAVPLMIKLLKGEHFLRQNQYGQSRQTWVELCANTKPQSVKEADDNKSRTMNKKETVLAVKSYEAGYRQACEDFAKAFVSSHGQSFEAAIRVVTQKMDASIKQATEKYCRDISIP